MDELLSDAFAQKLRLLAEQNAEKYRTAHPFPHIYFDDFLPEAAAEAALRDYPQPQSPGRRSTILWRRSWPSMQWRSSRRATVMCCTS
jgi:hypothetical protein